MEFDLIELLQNHFRRFIETRILSGDFEPHCHAGFYYNAKKDIIEKKVLQKPPDSSCLGLIVFILYDLYSCSRLIQSK